MFKIKELKKVQYIGSLYKVKSFKEISPLTAESLSASEMESLSLDYKHLKSIQWYR